MELLVNDSKRGTFNESFPFEVKDDGVSCVKSSSAPSKSNPRIVCTRVEPTIGLEVW